MPVRQHGSKVVISDAITSSDTNTTVAAVTIPAGSFVKPYGVSVIIDTAFAGGTPSLDVGDGDDTDGWVDSVDITETSTGTYSGTEANTAAYAQHGKYYSAEDTIDVVVSASLTAGNAYVRVEYDDVSDII